eukprot:6466195-Amphidinium_carterae.1
MDVVAALQLLSKGVSDCGIAKKIVRRYVDSVAAAITSEIESLSYTQDPLAADAPPQLSSKRIRRDEDYKVAILTTA